VSRFVPNRQFEDEMRQQSEHRQALEEAAESVQQYASQYADQAGAPWMRRQSEAIVVSTDGEEVAVVNTDYAGHLMEWGSRNNAAHAPLRRAVRAAGLHFEASPKAAA
jgi:GH18 family chitinase